MKIALVILLSIAFTTNLHARKRPVPDQDYTLAECYANIAAPMPKLDKVADKLKEDGLLVETQFMAGTLTVKLSSILAHAEFESKQLELTKMRLDSIKSDYNKKGLDVSYTILGCRATELSSPSKIDPPRTPTPKRGHVLPPTSKTSR